MPSFLDTLARAVGEGLQGFQTFQTRIRPALQEEYEVGVERKQKKAQSRLDFIHALTGGPHQAFQVYGDDYLKAVKEAQGVDIPTTEEPEFAPLTTRRQVGTRRVAPPGPFADVGPPVTATFPEEVEPGRVGLADVLRERRVRRPAQAVLTTPAFEPVEREEPVFEDVTAAAPTGRKRRVLALPAGAREITVTLASGERVPISALRGQSAEVIRHLLRGDQRGPAVTYGDVFGDAVTPQFQKVQVQYDTNGVMRWPPDRAFVVEKTAAQRKQESDLTRQQQALEAYKAELGRSGDVNKAWQAAAAVDPVAFKPELTTPATRAALEDRQRRLQALSMFNREYGQSQDLEAAYNAAFQIDPTFPRPGTLRAPEGPQAQVWRKFFANEGLTGNEQAFIDKQLQSAQQDPAFTEAMRVISAYAAGDRNGSLSAEQQRLFDQAQAVVMRQLGVLPPSTTTEDIPPKPPRGMWEKILRFLGIGGAPTTREVPGGAATQWAQAQFTVLQQLAQQTGRSVMSLFNEARNTSKGAGDRQVPQAYWKALYDLIQRGAR